MARRCELTGTGVQSGNKVSHSNRKTRRRFLPNLRKTSLTSEALGKPVSLRITAAALRTIEHHGGLDAYLLATTDSKLPEDARKLKRQIKKTLAK